AERKAKVQPRPVSWRRAARRIPVWRVVKRVGFYLLVAAIFVYALFPFYWVIRSAFTPEADLFVTPVRYIPVHPTFENFRLVLSLVAPALVTTGMLAFIAAWNEFLFALSFTETPDKHTVPVAITSFTSGVGGTFQYPWGEVMAATLIVTVPLIALTLILQRRI